MGTPFTRDMDTLGTDGPQATQFEAPTARETEAPEQINAGETAGTAPSSRPQFSPVAQPGQVTEVHWHTVKSEQREPGAESTGMVGRLHERPPSPRRRKRRGRGGG